MAAPSPAYPKIPLGEIPLFAHDVLPLVQSVVSGFFLLLLLVWDFVRALRRNKHWIPCKSFILGALVLQLLGSVEYSIVSISDERKLEPAFVKELFQKIHDYQLLLLGPRVFLCVLIGIIIPQVASSSAQNRTSNIWALLIGSVVMYIHISYESYIIESKYLIQYGHHKPRDWLLYNSKENWLLRSNSIISIAMFILIYFLLFVYLTSRSIRKVVVHKIPMLLTRAESRSITNWEEVEEEMVRSWITARTSQPEYIISRSIVASSTCFIVTLCVVVYSVQMFKNPHVANFQYAIAFASQYFFIFCGWMIVNSRCITAVVYYPRELKNLRTYFHLEDFWKRDLLEVYKTKFLVNFVVYPVFIFSKICWLISQWLFSNCCMERLVMPREYRSGNDGDFDKFSPAMMQMPGEWRKGLWLANLASVNKAKKKLLKEVECPELIALLRSQTSQVLNLYTDPTPSLEVEHNFYVGKRTAKIMVVSLLTVLIELSPSDGESSAHPNKNTVIQGCKDAWKIMELVEKRDPGAALVNKEADLLFSSITKNTKKPRWLGLTLPMKDAKTVQDAKGSVMELVQEGEKKISSSNDGYDSVNWTALIAIHYLKIVRESIQNCSVANLQDLLGAIQSKLADEIRTCVMRVKERIINECMLEAAADMEKEEEKLWKVFEVAGMAKRISESTGAAHDVPLTEAEQTV